MLGKNKGTGTDEVPAEVLESGGAPVACLLSNLYSRTFSRMRWPVAFQGGRGVNLWKAKGDKELTNNYRCLLLADHASKIPVQMLKHKVDSY